MLQKETQLKILGIIVDKMIPEYKNLLDLKKELKEVFIKFVESDYLKERDQELIYKYPTYIEWVNQMAIVYYRSDITIERPNIYHNINFIDNINLVIDLDKKMPLICSSLYDLKENKEAWEKIGPIFYKFINIRNIYVKKLNTTWEFLIHKNTTLKLIKDQFPELYKLYKP